MKTLIAAVLSALLFVPSVFGQPSVGQTAYSTAAFCMTKEDAVAIAKVDSEDGAEVAIKRFAANPNCGIGSAVMTIKSVVLSLPTKRGKRVSVLEVQVKLSDGSKQTLFALTDGEVRGVTNI